MVRESPCEEETLEQSLERSEGQGHAPLGENTFQASETRGAETLSMFGLRNTKKLRWLEQNEQKEMGI